MIRWIKAWAAPVLAGMTLVACSGGGSDPGSCMFDCTGSNANPTSLAVGVDVQRAGTSTTNVSSTETVQAVARVLNQSGVALEGVLVTFAEDGPGLAKFAPSSATALTDSRGYATVDLSAQSTSTAGATSITATAAVASVSASGSRTVSFTAGGIDEEIDPRAINFVSVVPADRAIVIKGAGGSGRSESATLSFRVVDENNTPVKGASVTFTVAPTNTVTLNITSAVSDADGLVTTTVQSGTTPTSVVVTARTTTLAGAAVTTQSDTLIVSNGLPMLGGFEIVAQKYNLDGRTTGDSTTISAFVRDANGNPVPDGVAVSFVTDLGSVASSELGGCLTENGTCDVSFRVQDPRGDGFATVAAQVVSGSTTLSDSININMAAAVGHYEAVDTSMAYVSELTLSSCKQTFELVLQDSANGRSAAAGTTIRVSASSSELSGGITSGSPVLDSLSFAPTGFTLEIDATSEDLSPFCRASGTVPANAQGFVLLQFATSNGVTFSQRVAIKYPQ